MHAEVRLKRGRDKKLRGFYPWVQRGEILFVNDDPKPGDIVRVTDSNGQFVAIASFNGKSRFPLRIFSLIERPIDLGFFAERIELAKENRARWISETNAMRVVFSEADGLPGLIIDQYADVLVVQSRTAAIDRLKPLWLEALASVFNPRGIYERSDMAGREEEGLQPFFGPIWGEPGETVDFQESGFEFNAPFAQGLKTGFYLDQRETRRKFETEVKPGESVADLFCYTGAMSLYAARAGATVVGVDILPEAIELANQHADRNNLKAEFIVGNAFEWLEASSEKYDWIILDPPAIAKSRTGKSSLKWAIWKLIYNALPRLKPNGKIVACSCSYQLSAEGVIESARLAASDRGRRLFLRDITIQAPDHPHLVQFPESLYLKCLWFEAD
ncbi:MAG: class I SAM-dependent rRNA methyltransferase [Armatimonadetes bacterium]|nr:class I SAM-dependent rRNA methyltransferase [Armatimonadota bacterium]